MFTGIIQHLGKVNRIKSNSNNLELGIDLGLLAKEIKSSDSLAVNGVCLTVTSKSGNEALFDVVTETITRTNLSGLKLGEKVNLERAIHAGEPFGGHFVTGHIDGTGTIIRKDKKANECLMEVAISPAFSKWLIEQGSIAIDGVSLTLVNVQGNRFSVALVPYTLEHTTLGQEPKGAKVNIEFDIIGKWVVKLVNPLKAARSLQNWLEE